MAADSLFSAESGSVVATLQINSTHLSRHEQPASHHPYVRQRKQHVQLRRVLGQSAVADLDVAELALDHPEGMFAAGADLCLQPFDLVIKAVKPAVAERPPLAGLHRHLPD